MDRNQYDICLEVLRRLDDSGILSKIILIGRRDAIIVDFGGLKMTLPHPVNFGLHKIIVSSRRTNVDKKAKDVEVGLEVLRLCIDNMDTPRIVELFGNVSQKQRKRVIQSLESNEAEDILKIVNPLLSMGR